jgi:hypothetical protein
MKRGIYITANDRVVDQAIALMNSGSSLLVMVRSEGIN